MPIPLPPPTTSNPNGIRFPQPHPLPGWTPYKSRAGQGGSKGRVKSYITNKRP